VIGRLAAFTSKRRKKMEKKTKKPTGGKQTVLTVTLALAVVAVYARLLPEDKLAHSA
jgi:hypothetical protein